MLFEASFPKIYTGGRYGANEINPQTTQWICLIIRSQYLFGRVARRNIYVRSGFRLWSDLPYLSPIIAEAESSAL
jgi:hypothetical protein